MNVFNKNRTGIDMLIRFFVSFVSNLQCINLTVQYTLGSSIGACSILVLMLVDSYEGMLLTAVITGVHLGKT